MIPDWIWPKLHLAWHGALVLASAYVVQYPAKYGWLVPVLQIYGQITPPPEWPSAKLNGGTK